MDFDGILSRDMKKYISKVLIPSFMVFRNTIRNYCLTLLVQPDIILCQKHYRLKDIIYGLIESEI